MFFKWQLLPCQVLQGWKMPQDVLKIYFLKKLIHSVSKRLVRDPATSANGKVKISYPSFTLSVLALG